MVEWQTRRPQKAVPTGREGASPSLATSFRGRLNGRTAVSETVDAGSTPAPGTLCPDGETDIMALSERAGPGSIFLVGVLTDIPGVWRKQPPCDGGGHAGSTPAGDTARLPALLDGSGTALVKRT